jgi:hypothetical protein
MAALLFSALALLSFARKATCFKNIRFWGSSKLTTSSHQDGIHLAQILGILLLVDNIIIRTLYLHFFSALRSHFFTGLFEECSEDIAITAVLVEYFVQRCVTLEYGYAEGRHLFR